LAIDEKRMLEDELVNIIRLKPLSLAKEKLTSVG
jgi:hypothetical protein